jgi:hypothetical protein
MKRNNQVIFIFAVLIVISAVYRVIPFDARPVWLGGPQLAMALFAGSVIKNRRWAFAVPLFSMLLSDLLIEMLYAGGAVLYPGFYKGQLFNYALISLLTVVGFFVKSNKVSSVVAGMVATPTLYFLLSNFSVWANSAGLVRPKSLAGLIQCYTDGIPFYGYSLLTMAVFGSLLFGGYRLFAPLMFTKKAKA